MLPDTILTTIASNRQLKTLNDLQSTLPTPWALVDRYGQQVLDLIRNLDDEDTASRESNKMALHEARRLESERKAAEQTVEAKSSLLPQRPRHAKENCNIPGTGW